VTSRDGIVADQLLFGYDDGHRLLNSSTILPSELESLLAVLSDLAPGLPSRGLEPYWTGTPAPEIDAYVLIKTWPAPEIPRPGAVWSHALIVKARDLSALEEISVLRRYFFRPNGSNEDLYSAAMHVAPLSPPPQMRAGSGDLSSAIDLLRTLYLKRDMTLFTTASEREIDDALFGVWAQQWPELRCSFAFRSRSGASRGTDSRISFDLEVVQDESRASRSVSSAEPAWIQTAAEDVIRPDSTGFRTFLRTFSHDVPARPKEFAGLASLFPALRAPGGPRHPLVAVLSQLAETWPQPQTAVAIKAEALRLSDGKSVGADDALDALEALVDLPQGPSFAIAWQPALDQLSVCFSNHPGRVVSIAERAVVSPSRIASEFLDALAIGADLSAILRRRPSTDLLRSLVERRPSLVESLIGRTIDEEQAGQLSRAISTPTLLAEVIDAIMQIDDESLAGGVIKRFPAESLTAIAGLIATPDASRNLTASWAAVFSRNAAASVQAGCLNLASATSGLHRLARAFGYREKDLRVAGAKPWTDALGRVTDDLHEPERAVFEAFLLALALDLRQPGTEALLEYSFDAIHRLLANDRLPGEAMAIVAGYLPNVMPWEQWDRCFRLRLAVVSAYVEGGLDRGSFERLSDERNVMRRLRQLADQTDNGSTFLARPH
jgi:hypothetical protein